MDLFNTVNSMKSTMPEVTKHTAPADRPVEGRKIDSERVKSQDFQDVLKKVDQEKSSSSQKKEAKSPKVQDVEKNIQSLEEKIQTLKQKASPEQKAELEKLEQFLSKLKQVLAKMKTSQSNGQKNTNNIDFLSLMSQVLEEISQILDEPNAISKMTKKLEAIEGKLDNKQSKSSDDTSSEMKLFQDNDKNAVKVEAKQEAVKIVDRRDIKRSTLNKVSAGKQKAVTTETTNTLFKDALHQNTQTSTKEDNAAQAIQNLQARTTATQQLVSRQYTSYSSGVSRAHMESMMQSVTGKAVVTLNDGKSEVRMRLNPPELGKMSLKFSLEDGKMIGKIVVSTTEAKMLWDQNLDNLQKSLQNAGIDVQSMNVDVGNEDNTSQEQELFAKDGSATIKAADISIEESEREYVNLYDSSVNYIA